MSAAWIAVVAATAAAATSTGLLLASRRRKVALEQALAKANENLEHLEQSFSKFAPQDVVEKLSAGASEIPPERREVTVMFTDIAGFTRLSEQVDPAIMVPILNDYFSRMTRVVREHHGHVSRIMGDGLMALFGSLSKNRWQAADAVKAALAMRAALVELNEELKAAGHPELRIGVGIHRGDVVAAVVGSRDMMEFTVMGDVVNVASRVESLTRQHGVDILITDAVRQKLDQRYKVRELGTAAVKGKTEPVNTWAVDGFEEPHS